MWNGSSSSCLKNGRRIDFYIESKKQERGDHPGSQGEGAPG